MFDNCHYCGKPGFCSDLDDCRERLFNQKDELIKKSVRWSFCTQSGMLRHCPEKADELAEFLVELNISST